jgi:hypothetical protein
VSDAGRRLFFLLALLPTLAGCHTPAIENRREVPPWTAGRLALNLATEPPQAFRRPGTDCQAEPVPAHHRAPCRRLPPAAVGVHADRLVRHAALRTAHGRPAQPGRPGRPDCRLTIWSLRDLPGRCSSSCGVHPMGAHIGVDKRIPAQAGMGGGSSDAASPPCWHSTACGTEPAHEQLWQIGLSLGADVPFFLRGRNAWVEGIGEHHHPAGRCHGAVCCGQTTRGIGNPHDFLGPGRSKRDTKPATISGFAANPTTLAVTTCSRLPSGIAPASPKPLTGLSAAVAGPDDRLWKCGVCTNAT